MSKRFLDFVRSASKMAKRSFIFTLKMDKFLQLQTPASLTGSPAVWGNKLFQPMASERREKNKTANHKNSSVQTKFCFSVMLYQTRLSNTHIKEYSCIPTHRQHLCIDTHRFIYLHLYLCNQNSAVEKDATTFTKEVYINRTLWFLGVAAWWKNGSKWASGWIWCVTGKCRSPWPTPLCRPSF